MTTETEHELTIDELARETGMTVRNIRAHQSRGLLPPPEVRARTGYYGPEHVARIRLIQELQAEGFNLKAIARLVSSANGASAELLELQRTMLGSWGQEEPEFATMEELDQRLGGPFDPKTARKAEKLGLIRPLGDGRFEIPSPTLIRAGEELVALGIPVTHVLAVAEQLDRNARAVAKSFVRLFRQDVVGDSIEHAARDPEELARLREAVDRLRPIANDALHAGFQLRMSEAVERELQQLLES